MNARRVSITYMQLHAAIGTVVQNSKSDSNGVMVDVGVACAVAAKVHAAVQEQACSHIYFMVLNLHKVTKSRYA